jgi:hypothetical protein
MKENTMKRILWFLTAIGVALVAGAVLLGDQGTGKAAEEAAGKAADEAARSWLASAFEGKEEAVETVVMLKEKDGSWKSAGYFIE